MHLPNPYDKIGYWSEIKLDILNDYAKAYSQILSNQRSPELYHIYIDAFAGAGTHISRTTGEMLDGSPKIALSADFKEYYFIDLDEIKVQCLEELSSEETNVHIYHGDCNKILKEKVFPEARFEDYRRALCILDPYGLHLDWEIIKQAGQMKSVEIFLNFPVADMNRNVLWKNADSVPAFQLNRMDRFWGDRSWSKVAYQPPKQLCFEGFVDECDEKVTNIEFAEAFRDRLKKEAGFKYVPKPIAMRNTQNAIVYYLFFASQKPVAAEIVKYIFKKYENRRG